MMSKLSTPKSWSARLLRGGLAGLATLAAGAVLATGCLDRPIVPATPSTSNVYVDQIIQSAVDKIDLLFMIDNSTSMADKQDILALAVPQMVSRLVSPICVDAMGVPVGGSVDANGACPAPGVPEFSPIKDIHIAIVTSSLGSHGGDVCNSAPNADDLGQTLGSMRNIPGWNNSGFLAWDPGGNKNPLDENTVDKDATALGTKFSDMVKAAGEQGCGYEASLEAWYRFLIDLEPPTSVVNVNNTTTKMGTNTTLLTQRSLFLRPDSLVAVIMLSDENDCSIADAGYGWFLSTRTLPNGVENRMYRSTHFCDANPNDPCCMSCGDGSQPPPQCNLPNVGADSSCQMNGGYLLPAEDSVSLRCWDSKRRFGFDLMYPTQRYSNALQNPKICKDSTGYLAGGCPNPDLNPLFDPNIAVPTGGKPGTGAREPTLVFASAIIGVPWQDIATADTLGNPQALKYMTEAEMEDPANNRWAVILGDPSNPAGPVLPTDPFMVETDVDRTTLPINKANPITGDMLVDHTSTNPQANVINGHEQNVVGFDDLQYACIFPLTPAKTCANGQQACDCSPTAAGDTKPITDYNSPLCNPPGGGPPTATQNYAKGYPGLRFLKVLHDFGKNAIPASICPKVVTSGAADFGYNPAVAAIINRLKDALHGRCLPRPLDAEQINPQDPALGSAVPCAVVEATYADPAAGGGCPVCDNGNGRGDANPKVIPAVIQQMQEHGQCGVAGGRACEDFCFCEILQETGAAGDACRKDPIGSASSIPPGYCYISNKDVGAPCNSDADCTTGTCGGASGCAPSGALTKCPDNQKQLLGFVSGVGTTGQTVQTPANGAIGFIACLGASISGG